MPRNRSRRSKNPSRKSSRRKSRTRARRSARHMVFRGNCNAVVERWTQGDSVISHAYSGRWSADETFSASVIQSTKRPVSSYAPHLPHLWFLPESLNLLLAFQDDIGRSGYGQNILYNPTYYSDLKEALTAHGFGDKFNSRLSVGTPMSDQSLTENQILDLTPDQNYNEVIAKYNNGRHTLHACACVFHTDKPDFFRERVNAAHSMQQTLNMERSIFVVNATTGGIRELDT